MAGHSHWKQIKAQKGAADKKKSAVFSKLLNAISVAARQESNPAFNPRLRSAMEKAKDNKIPQENIERAIGKASKNKNLEEIIIEAYGPEKTALIIEAITDNKNRTIAEIRHLLDANKAKMADPGSVLWAFDPPAPQTTKQTSGGGEWKAKFPQQISDEGKRKLQIIIEKLEEHNDVQCVITNSQ